MNQGDKIRNYTVVEPIGQGGAGYTYKIHDGSELELCLKEFRFGLKAGAEDTSKTRELFKRETKTLQSLNHPQIPKYVDSFTEEDNDEEKLYLVMEHIEGNTLAEVVKDRRVDLDYVIDTAKQVANVLSYIHAFTPPIIHRDIKPENLIETKDGKIKLVDFGSVTDAIMKGTKVTWTSVGTFGFAAPETFYGRATPASDIYSLGSTLLYLISGGADIGELFLNDDNRLDFRGKLSVPKEVETLLYRMTEPNVKRRIQGSEQLREMLYGGNSITKQSNQEKQLEPQQKEEQPTNLVTTEKKTSIKFEKDGLIITPIFKPIGFLITRGIVEYKPWDLKMVKDQKSQLESELEKICKMKGREIEFVEPTIKIFGIEYKAEAYDFESVERKLPNKKLQKKFVDSITWQFVTTDNLLCGSIDYFKKSEGKKGVEFINEQGVDDVVKLKRKNSSNVLRDYEAAMRLVIDPTSLGQSDLEFYMELQEMIENIKV